jgi:integrase
MTVFKRGGVWWFQFFYRSQRIQESTRQGNRQKALDIEAARRTAFALGEVGLKQRKPAPKFDVAMQEFLTWSEQEHQVHPATHRRLKISSIALLKFFKKLPLDRITVDELEAFKKHRLAQKSPQSKRLLRPATVNRELACIRSLFNFYIRQDVLVGNPVSRIRFLAENNEHTRVLTFDEQSAYLAECSQPLRDVAALLVETGMRPDEIYRLRVVNVNLKSGYVFNPYGKTKSAKRKIPLTTTAAAILHKRLQTAKGSYVFGSQDDPNKPITKLNKPHGTAIKRCKVPKFRLYDLRHTFATRAVESEVDLVTLAALLGHSKISMIQRYAHPAETHKAEAIRKIELMCTERIKHEQADRESQTAVIQ